MDELVHHCLRELSFDGDLGCNVSRLTDFIAGFYASKDDHSQRVDDAFCAFVWSVVVQQPSVRVGILPPGLVSEVYIAPQTSAKRKAAAKGEQVTEGVPPTLHIVEDARLRHLEDLKHEYGDNLRIAVDPETSFAAITGSHIRPSKLSPMVYSALQLITRGREDGITTVELGRKTNYDQKTCFYLIKQLVELGLIIKARRGGVGNHTCIHKYFVERSPLWQQILQEEARNDAGADGELSKPRDTSDRTADEADSSQARFDPIDSRHLSSLPLVKNRIVKLLKASNNHVHQSNNLLITIGFINPTKTDRRFFQTRLRELIQQGIIERVLVPSSKTRDRTVKCIRLVTLDDQLPEGSVVVRQDMDEDDKDASLADDVLVGRNEIKANLTIHKQVSNMLEQAGASGLTLNEICSSLGNFDKRTIELLLTRASNGRPPPHLADLGTVDLMETYGRERRHRYFTLAAYKCVMASERLQDATPSAVDIDLSRVGNFATLDAKHFYTTTAELYSHQDSFKDMTTTKGKKRKRDEGSDGEESEPPPKKRGRPRKTPAPASPPKRRGRPRKIPVTEAQSAVSMGSPSKRLVEEGYAQAPAAEQADNNARDSMDAIQRPVAVTESFPGTINTTEQPTCFPVAVPASKTSDVGSGTSHPALEGNDICSQGSAVTTRRSSKRARSFVLCANQYSMAKPTEGGAMMLNSPQSVGRDDAQGNSSAVVVQGEDAIVVSPTAKHASSTTPGEDVVTSGEQRDSNPHMSLRPSKRSRTSGGGKSRSNINLSSLRRENELHRVIESMGGIANMHSKDIFEAHTTLLDTLTQAKEPTSAPVGTRIDKRTAEATLKNLENRGRIKMLKTSLVAPSGISRPACLVYLSNTPQEKVNDFLRQLSQNTSPSDPNSDVTHHAVPDRSSVAGQEILHDVGKVTRVKRKRGAAEGQSSESKSIPRRKEEQVHLQHEQDWNDLLQQVHPEPVKGALAIRIRAVRNRFMQSAIPIDQSKWESEIQDAVKKAQLVSKKPTLQLRTRPGIQARSPAVAPPPVVPNPPEKSIEVLIAQQGPPIVHAASVKRKGKAKEESEASRRPRFHWTREFDELARDASAIIRARCRSSRLDLSAFDQVFPAVPRNSVRQRITHLRENAAEDLYLKRLEDQWYTVWLQYRGTSYLPDEDPSCPSNFGLINHIHFLRKHVDKNALRVGFVERETPCKLASSVAELDEFYEIGEDPVSVPTWDFMWGSTVEEGREKQFRNQAFTKEPDHMYEVTKNDMVQLAEAALKLVFGTPTELYDPERATRLLRSVGDQYVSAAKSNLLQQGVLSKLVRDPKKPKPGRMLKISDTNLNGLGGQFPRDLFQDANSLEDIAVEQVVDEMEWPLIASEGDIATLLQLVSEDQIGFTIDLTQSQISRQKIDWNSKRADDEDIETTIRLRFSRQSALGMAGNQAQNEDITIESDSHAPMQNAHGRNLDGEEAACSLKTEFGFINCSACIRTAFSVFSSCLNESDRELAGQILNRARTVKETGLHKAACLALETGPQQHILGLIHKMTLTSPPILIWTYFNAPVIVAGDYCGAWGVMVSDEPLTFISPRRWLDIRGYRLDSAWTIAQQAVVGVIFLHPGISQAEVRWRLRMVYDRQEIIDLLSSLQEDGVLECRANTNVETIQSTSGWLKALNDEEMGFWFIAKNHHWYQS